MANRVAPKWSRGSISGNENMNNFRYGNTLAAREHLADGLPITRLEALILYGVQNLAQVISSMRREGWVIESKRAPYAAAVRRVNEHAVLTPPPNLPIRDIHMTEYWVSK